MSEPSACIDKAIAAATATFESYIAGDLDTAAAARDLTAPIARAFHLPDDDHQDSNYDGGIEGLLWSTWGALMQVVRRTAHDDPAQDALVRLLAAIKELQLMPCPNPSSAAPYAAFERSWGKTRFWHDLPILGPTIREDWNGTTDDHPELPLSQKTYAMFYSREQWASMNAFVARLTAARVMNFSVYGIWTMRETFEEALGTVGLDNHVPGAAVWILQAGSLMYDLAQKAQPPHDIQNASNGGPLWKGGIWYSTERWAFWRQGFSAAMGQHELHSWTKEMAARAHHKMQEIEEQASGLILSNISNMGNHDPSILD